MQVDHATHRQLAVELFNLCWTIMGQETRTQEDNDKLERAAMASLYHWSQVGDAGNVSIGEWMASRVHIVLRNKAEALRHAQRCLDITEAAGLQDFYLAFAYETRARANALQGDAAACKADQERSKAISITEDDDKEIYEKDFFGGEWFGLNPAK